MPLPRDDLLPKLTAYKRHVIIIAVVYVTAEVAVALTIFYWHRQLWQIT